MMMKKSAVAFRSFLEGFAQSGLFGSAAMPGGAQRILEETANLEDSEFADLLLPVLRWSTTAEPQDSGPDSPKGAVRPLKHAGGFLVKTEGEVVFLDRATLGVRSVSQQHGSDMRLNSDIFGPSATRGHAEKFEGNQYTATYTGSSELWPRTVKRILDGIVASCALLLLSPILAAAAIAIKLTSPGPIFFRQERMGLNKRRFKIFKFRTMVPNAEELMVFLERRNEVAGPVFKMKNDPRITPIGKFLRRSSIDELPQLLNVLMGDMSLVGPRPLPVRDYEGFNEDWQRRRFSVKPGMILVGPGPLPAGSIKLDQLKKVPPMEGALTNIDQVKVTIEKHAQ
jgi:lipopolysaccharide/colanic/teichoic acid biosynthesis glycosyltransferase